MNTGVNPKILVISGPTASGKTALAIKAAQRFSGEVISADSMQVYRGLDVGTAKPDAMEQQGVAHHLIDILDIDASLDVFNFVAMAEQAIAQIRSRGHLPVIAGGTGFYLKALLYGLDPLPADPEIRAELDRRFDHPQGHEELKEIMQSCDPRDLERWHMHRRKLIRAYEVFLISGKSISEWQTLTRPELRFPVVSINLCREREELKTRIRQRTVLMLENGWIKEAENMIAAGLLNTPTAHQAMGYKLIGMYLDGIITYDELIERIATATWQLARRQITWFKKQHPETRHILMPCDEEQLLRDLEPQLYS
jgi:tRNA dimethylallyltransferase